MRYTENNVQDLMHPNNRIFLLEQKKETTKRVLLWLKNKCNKEITKSKQTESKGEKNYRKCVCVCVYDSGKWEDGWSTTTIYNIIWYKKRRDNDIDSCFLSFQAKFSLVLVSFHTESGFCFLLLFL